MLIRKLSATKLLLLLSLSIQALLSGCQTVTIKNRTACVANGKLSLGATCAETITGKTAQITLDQSLEMLEYKAPDPDPSPSSTGHAPAIWQSADDYGEETTELQVACRLLGSACSYELQQTIENRKKLLEQVRSYREQ